MNRKDDHIKLALMQNNLENSFDLYNIEYHSIPEFSIEDISLKTKIADMEFEYPFFINAITGGSDNVDKINEDLEYIARKTNIFIFFGSYSPFLNKNNKNYPKGYGVNLGIDKSVDKHIQAVKETRAKILQVHTNLIQEILMPEGDKNFKEWEDNLKDIVNNIDIPIILKETGFGMSKSTIQKAIKLGIKIVDVSGKDGTDFAKIENSRRNTPKYYYEQIGISTTESIRNAKEFDVEVIASGGIRNPLDVVKCLALGAKWVGISKTFLEILLNEGREKLIDIIEEWKKDIKYLMLITNSRNIDELVGKIYRK